MMKEVVYNLVLFCLLAVAFSAVTSCTGTASSEKGTTDQAVGNKAANTAAPAPEKEISGKSSEYPPIASAVANADMKNLDGSTFKVTDKKGKVLLLNMWATWCGPCRAEMPALVRMHETHGPQGFEVIGLNTDDETVEDINKFAGEMKLNYPLVWADTELQTALLKISKFGGIPQSFVIDREGRLRGVFKGANPADIKKMEELVAQVVNEG